MTAFLQYAVICTFKTFFGGRVIQLRFSPLQRITTAVTLACFVAKPSSMSKIQLRHNHYKN